MFVSDIIKEERQEGFEQGREEGLVQGRKEGFEEGEIRRAVAVVDNLISRGFSEEEACSVADITVEEYQGYENSDA